MSESGYKVARPTPPGTIIQVCIGGSIGKCAIVDREVTFNQQINSITVIKCSTQYGYSVLSSDYFHCIIREYYNRELADALDMLIDGQEGYIDDLKNEIINLDNLLEYEMNNKE